MAFRIRRVSYFRSTVEDQPGQAYELLSRLADLGVNLLAFDAVPLDTQTQLTLYPEEASKMQQVAGQAGMSLDGPHSAILVQGDDELGALAGVHVQLSRVDVTPFASTGVGDGRGGFGYLVHVRPEEFERAATALEL